jgi:formate-nitrite transporter family protein
MENQELDANPYDGSEPLKSHQAIFEQEVRLAVLELKRPALGLFMSGLLAGFSLGISVFLIGAIKTLGEGQFSEALMRLLVANAYSVGFIVVILGSTDLFTEYTTVALLPVLKGDATLRQLLRLWGLVYVGNLAGGAVFAVLSVVLGPGMGVIRPQVFSELGFALANHSWWLICLSGILAGWLIGLLSWLVVAARETISQIFFVWIITGAVGLGHLHHSIAGAIEVVAAMLVPGDFGMKDAGHFLVWTTLGNIGGAILFAVVIRYSVLRRAQ